MNVSHAHQEIEEELSAGRKFMELFSGLDRAHGLGIGRIEKTPPTQDLFQLHLAGKGSGLGIFPLMDDGTVNFAAIDLDEPNFELAATLQSLLPGETWIERSRSGNAHIWAFFKEPVPGWIPRGIMQFALEAVGRTDVEIFPKQDKLLEGMVGNYINLPWHGRNRPILHPPLPDDGANTLQEPFEDRGAWVALAYGTRNDPEEWYIRARALDIKPPEERPVLTREQGELGFLHDCALHIIRNRETNPVIEGHRNAVFFHVTKQLLNYREMTEDEAHTLLHELNAAAQPPAPDREVDRIFNNARKGGFTGTGCDDPLMAPYVLDTCPIAHPGGSHK